MIAHIRGKVTEKFGNSLIIDVSGVGYEITVPTPDFDATLLDEEKKFFTYNSIRENGTSNHVQLGSTPLIRAKTTTTTRLISILITAVKVAETTTIYFGKEIFRMRSPRTTMA